MPLKTFTDQLFRKVEVPFPPQRIVSLVPSQTELLFYLGLSDRVVGITKFCIHPTEWLQIKPKVGGTKNFRFDVIDQLKPDLIIGNKEENYLKGIRELEANYPVWMSDISSFENALRMIEGVGQLTDRKVESNGLTQEIKFSFEKLKPRKPLEVIYLIWKSPWIAVGKNTFIDNMLSKIGLDNVVSQNRYPQISETQLQHLQPDVIMLSSEPFPFNHSHINELQQLLPKSKVMLVDGEMFSWYGSRMLQAPTYFNSLDFQ